MVQDLVGKLKLKVHICIFGKLFGGWEGKGTLQGTSPYPRGKEKSSFSKVPWVGNMDLFPGG